MNQATDKQISEFIRGYLEAALWSSTHTFVDPDDQTTELQTVSLDDYEWADGQEEKLAEECRDFIQANYADLHEYTIEYSPAPDAGDRAWASAGHDFWLTRNGHGAGFWDRGLGELGERLTTAAKVYGGIDLYLGDDELVYS